MYNKHTTALYAAVKLIPNVVFATDRRIIIRDPSMLGLREDIVDILYDMISSVRIDKGVYTI
jgi:hypothetical protein